MKLSINLTAPQRKGRAGQRQTQSNAEVDKNMAGIQADCFREKACGTVADTADFSANFLNKQYIYC